MVQNYQLQRSVFEDPDAQRQIDRGIAKLDSRIMAAVGSQVYDHVEGSLKELVRLRTVLNDSRYYQNFNPDLVEHYINEFLRIEDKLTKQKTAYEIRLSLVGSEMCIRDRFSNTSIYLSLCIWVLKDTSLELIVLDHVLLLVYWVGKEIWSMAVSYTHLTLPTICSV